MGLEVSRFILLLCSGPDKKVAILRKESAELRNHVLMQQKDLEMFEHSLNHAIDVSMQSC